MASQNVEINKQQSSINNRKQMLQLYQLKNAKLLESFVVLPPRALQLCKYSDGVLESLEIN